MHLSLSTFAVAVRLVDELADLESEGDFAAAALPALQRIVDCDLITYNEIGAAPEVQFVDYPTGGLQAGERRSFVDHVHEHPLVNYYRETDDGRPVMISDFLTRAQFHRLGLYGEFFRRISIEHQLAFTLRSVGSPGSEQSKVVGFALNRSGSDFNDVDRDLLYVLRPILANAVYRVQRRQAARSALGVASPERLNLLSLRESTVLRLVARGYTNAAIGRKLGISPRTVAKHLETIYRKLEVANRAAAVAIATQQS